MFWFLFALLAYFPLVSGLIIGECKEPNEWKTWLNAHRPTTFGWFISDTEFSSRY